jgi:DNA-directed RNA polymerase specialized sigma24 family protein
MLLRRVRLILNERDPQHSRATLDDARELVQEFIQKRLPRLEGRFNKDLGEAHVFFGFCLLNFARSKGNARRVLRTREVSLDFGAIATTETDKERTRGAVISLGIAELPPKYKAVIEARLSSRDYTEIAAALGIKVTLARARYSRGLRELKKMQRWMFKLDLPPDIVRDWPAFCRRFIREATQFEPGFAKELWRTLHPAVRSRVEEIADTTLHTPVDREAILHSISAGLSNTGLLDFHALAGQLPPEAAKEMRDHMKCEFLGPRRIRRMNRLLFQACFSTFMLSAAVGYQS